MSEEMTAANKEKLVTDLKVVISDTEELLRATAGAAGEKVSELRDRLSVRLRDTKERVLDLEAALVDKTKAAARATDDFVHEEPWKAVGVAAALGLALGVLIGRR
ncbi:MAG: DUF883 domain-containing protein [Dechloromonas sp.]|uniref:DUF883 family protein n=1 Tax=Azonexaceae TaxID=2008795 RepID=UPI001CF8456E|nr:MULTISPECIES: DUF883 family protein [Azonexaceae]MBT9522774.1 DUF883 domain-containing protein [Dechloromonas sp.]UCV23117.1 DUF883 domain-containing protein [Ferribacterium limneticum]